MPADALLVAALSDLHRHGPVNGACLLFGGYVVANHLPISDKRANLVCSTVTEMCDGYQSVGRNITEFIFGYDKGHALIFCERKVRLIILVEVSADLDQLVMAARHFMQENCGVVERLPEVELTQKIKMVSHGAAKVVDETVLSSVDGTDSVLPVANSPEVVEEQDNSLQEWIDYKSSLHGILARVLGSGQSMKMIDRVIKEHGYGKLHPQRIDFVSIAETVIEKVPNRSTRRSLDSLAKELIRRYRS